MKIYDVLYAYYNRYNDKEKLWNSIEEVSEYLDCQKDNDKDKYWKMMRKLHEVWNGKHYDEMFAEWEVEQMYHIEGDRESRGEYWTRKQTNDVLAQYRSRVPSQYNECDFYVALNATYHDLVVSKKKRFPDRYESEIIEDAIAFWFNDDDKPDGKVWWYFNR